MFTTYYFVNCLRLQRYVVFCKVQLKFVSCVFLNVSCTIKQTYFGEKKGFAAHVGFGDEADLLQCRTPDYRW